MKNRDGTELQFASQHKKTASETSCASNEALTGNIAPIALIVARHLKEQHRIRTITGEQQTHLEVSLQVLHVVDVATREDLQRLERDARVAQHHQQRSLNSEISGGESAEERVPLNHQLIAVGQTHTTNRSRSQADLAHSFDGPVAVLDDLRGLQSPLVLHRAHRVVAAKARRV